MNHRAKFFLKLFLAFVIIDVAFWGYVRVNTTTGRIDDLGGAILWTVGIFFLLVITAVFFGLFVVNYFRNKEAIQQTGYRAVNYGAIGSAIIGIILWGKYFGTLYGLIPSLGGIPESWFLVFGGIFLCIGFFSLLRSLLGNR